MPIQKCALLHFRDTHQRISPPGVHRELAHTLINICARWKLHKYWRKQILTAMIQSFVSAQCTLESISPYNLGLLRACNGFPHQVCNGSPPGPHQPSSHMHPRSSCISGKPFTHIAHCAMHSHTNDCTANYSS